MTRLFAILACLTLALPASALEVFYPALFRVTGVASNDVLNIREEPSAQAPIVGSLQPHDTAVEVLGRSDDGRWGLVRTPETHGWSSMRYLAPLGHDPWFFGKTEIVCSGTEPFWTMTYFRPTNRVEYIAPDDSFEMRVMADTPPHTLYPQTMGLPLTGARQGFAVIRQSLCFDGMSDSAYGLETQVYWQGDHAPLSGCCMLRP
ncbi:MAG: hypothetical protein Kow0013_03660 [Pararhodobacter sp.]